MRKGFADAKLPYDSPFSSDLLKISEIFEQNLEIYFKKRVKGVETSNLKLARVHFTVIQKEKSEAIEQKTKKEIIDLIVTLTTGLKEDEKSDILSTCTKSRNKQFLINAYQELLEGQSNEALNMIEEDE